MVNKLKLMLAMPPGAVPRKITGRLMAGPQRRRDQKRGEGWLNGGAAGVFKGGHKFAGSPFPLFPGNFASTAIGESLRREGKLETVRFLAREAAAHRFDLLGSGPVKVGYCTESAGFEGHHYQMPPGPEQERLARNRIAAALQLDRDRFDPGVREKLRLALDRYNPIDWHLDFRSGYRWEPLAWSRAIPVGRFPGAEVKIPWELSRFQHLGVMGLAFRSAGGETEALAAEFVLQITDWMVHNPRACGVNWCCTMEAAIRVVNWLLGYTFFLDSPLLAAPFRALFTGSLYEHAMHIRQNLERYSFFTGNHYLADLAGMISLEAACPWLPRSDRWLAFAARELVKEMRRQVKPDGSNFEASTGYHRLAAEIFLIGSLLLMSLDRERRLRLQRYAGRGELDFGKALPFPGWYLERLIRMFEYIADLAKPDGRLPLLGDFDSGRLFKLTPVGAFDRAAASFQEDFRDFRYLLAIAGRIFGRGDFPVEAGSFQMERLLFWEGLGAGAREALKSFNRSREAFPGRVKCGGAAPPRKRLKKREAGAIIFSNEHWPVQTRITLMQPAARDHETENGACGTVYYPYAGVVIFRSGPFYLAFTCFSRGSEGWGVHAHNDKLSFELNVCGQDFIVDPGVFTYSALAEERNAFRATAAHNTLAVPGKEQNRWIPGQRGLFLLEDQAGARIEALRPGSVQALHHGFGPVHRRTVRVFPGAVELEDLLGGRCANYCLNFNLHPAVDVIRDDLGGYILRRRDLALQLSVAAGGAAVEGRMEKGFYAPSYGVKLPAARLSFAIKS